MSRGLFIVVVVVLSMVAGCSSMSHVRAAVDAPTPSGPSCAMSCQALPAESQYDCVKQCRGAIVVFGADCGRPDPRTICVVKTHEPDERNTARAIGLLGVVALGVVVVGGFLYALESIPSN